MLAQKYRLRSQKDFDRLHRRGQKIKGDFIYARFIPSCRDYPRVGFLIGSRLSKKATVRNRFKRLAREAVQKNLNKFKAVDILFCFWRLPQKGSGYQEVEKELLGLLKKVKE